jgi:D-lactate dehydrogenase
MKQLKKLVDPANLLNPGIVITEDPLLHIHHLKVMPIVEEEVDRCIECGFCESACPSRDLTLTPRRRIGVRRAIKRAETAGDLATKEALLKDYVYDGLETCATDGMCATKCPVDINTGDLVKRLRKENHSASQNKMALKVAKNFTLFERASRMGLKTGNSFNRLFGQGFMPNVTALGRKLIPGLPNWSKQFQKLVINGRIKAGTFSPQTKGKETMEVLYFSSCISRMMSGEVIQSFLSVCEKANVEVIIPNQIEGSCCGQIFSSKGFSDAYRFMSNQTVERLWKGTQNGKIPIVLDVSSCTQTLLSCRDYLSEENQARFDAMSILDIIDFAADHLVSRLEIRKPKEKIVFHPVCSVQKMGLMPKLKVIGTACAKQADIPVFAACCGMAGDRGLVYPELTNAATKIEAQEVQQQTYDGYYSTSKTCEMALSQAVGQDYESILQLLDEVS